MVLKYSTILMAFLLSFGIYSQENCSGNWLSIDGNKLLDSNRNEVYLAGVNWFGFETKDNVVHGVWARDVYSVLQQTKDLGFNCFRLPWHNLMLRDGAKATNPNIWVKDPYTYDGVPEQGPYSNLYLEGKTKPIEILDEIVKWCQENDMKIILDCHSRNPDGYLSEGLWYTDTVSDEEWIEDWVFMANRYKKYDAVIGMDLNNEPHGTINDPEGARWGTGDPANDWRLAAERCGNAILKENPNVLIIVEGIEAYTKPDGTQTSYWWGGNLQGARDFPVRLNDPSKLMYSPHEYGPTVFAQTWFKDPNFPDNLPAIWEEQFNFLNTNETSPLLIGELGIKTKDGDDEKWFKKFIEFIRVKKLHFTFWSLNPNSGDTGGIFANDWYTVVDWKMEYLKPILSNPIPNCIPSNQALNTVEFKSKDASLFITSNPVKDLLTFSYGDSKIENIKIFDINGRMMDQYSSFSDNTYNVSGLSAGIYFAHIQTDKSISVTKKFIKI